MKASSLFSSGFYLADGGLETTLIYHQGMVLNHFAAFELLHDTLGRQALQTYYESYLDVAHRFGLQYILESPTWRSNPDWGYKLGYSACEIHELNQNSIHFLRAFMAKRNQTQAYLISGCIGPRGDGYKAGARMRIAEATEYHQDQVHAFAFADVDVITAMTMTYSEEAIGIVSNAKSAGVPVVISFTLETDGNLPGGESLQEAIAYVDSETGHYAAHFMINCAHPSHFAHILQDQNSWKKRIRGIRANASQKSHAELDVSETLDMGDRRALAHDYKTLKQLLPELRIFGGCCGTDHRHLEEICRFVLSN